MKLSRFLFLVVAATMACALSGAVANADGLDPKIGLGGTGSSLMTTQTNCGVEADFSCVVTLDSTGSGIADITNNTGFNLASDTVTIAETFLGSTMTAFAPPLVCDPVNPYGYNSVSGGTGSETPSSCTYSEVPVLPDSVGGGVTYGIHFTGFCQDVACVTPLTSLRFTLDWVNGTTPTPTPEPGTLLLLGTGVATLVAKRRSLLKRA